ncbi:exodeoxyribonuclease VII small subunit [Salinisphaera sp. T31B1]|uniref:exodeoxyribonuclease VII small subunit n=1 Tax=Salinisphaera sp. T31B1 TaxID=727963 RepID=UPI003340B5F9
MARKSSTPSAQATDTKPGLGDFEASVAELETLVEALEAGDISLEDALGKFERGVTLARQCQSLLKQAELRVDQLLADGAQEQVVAFDRPDDASPG